MSKDLAPRHPQNGTAHGISNFHLPACLFQYWRALESLRQKDKEAELRDRVYITLRDEIL
jgi:hypothetical protein